MCVTKLRIWQFHVKGFVNHYAIDSTSEDGRMLVAAIENNGAGWRGRETYRTTSDDEFAETFALASRARIFQPIRRRFLRKK